MWAVALPVTFAVGLWWASTVLVMYLDGMRSATHRWSMVVSAVFGAAAVLALADSAADTTPAAMYQGFVAAIVLWGFNELAFLTGYVTGPRKIACGEQCRGWARFRHAVAAIAYHEAALVASLGAIAAATWGGANSIGLATFGALWVMRLSSKLNVFFGVPNSGAELLPDGLAYLRGFFRRTPTNRLFPWSVAGLTLAGTHLIYSAAVSVLPGEQTGLTLLAVLVLLGTLEHWLLVLPLKAEALWSLGLRSRRGADGARLAPAVIAGSSPLPSRRG